MLVILSIFLLTLSGDVLSESPAPPCKPEPTCPLHEHYTVNNTECIKTCANRNVPPSNCCKPYTGCYCDPGYMRLNDDATGPCVDECKCPPVCPKNERYVEDYPHCQRTCGNRLVSEHEKCKPYSGCICVDGYIRKYDDASGICIPEEQCPPIPEHCGVNEEPTSCAKLCPPQTCASLNHTYYCLPVDCEPGCNCIDGYLRNDYGECIPAKDCCKEEPIKCGPYEEESDCKIICPPQSCESIYTTYDCPPVECTRGCNCIDGYLRNKHGECIPSEECDADLCDGDKNATRTPCGSLCQSTCAEPDKYHGPCIEVCIANSCECKYGYIRSDTDDVCIDPSDCPGGAPVCGCNETYVPCKVPCPSNYCPQDDSLYMVACSPPYPCHGGCVCKPGYLLESYENPRCILASDCRPVKCSRQNEKYDAHPTRCYLERCEDKDIDCDNYYPNRPRCVCKDGYYRNASDICVPACECPDLGCGGDLNATRTDCSSACPTTCADLQNKEDLYCPTVCGPSQCECKPGYVLTEDDGYCIDPKDCPEVGCKGDYNATYTDCTSACPLTCADQDPNKPCPAICNPPGCECLPGYVLTAIGGQCIAPSDCPADTRCDDNSTYSNCPSACQPTCDCPNADVQCTEQCMPPGCVCKEGYLLDKPEGKCINPYDCPGGSPKCGINETYTHCKVKCLDDYCPCDDSLDTVACDAPNPCPGGCECLPGYLWLSVTDERCIRSSECPPVKCNRDNEIWDPEPRNCGHERCDNRHIPCDFPYPLPPKCVCIKGYYRNEDNICVPERECPDYGCGGDPNAMYSECPSACQTTCQNMYSKRPCLDVCLPPGCVCKPGYVLNEETGQCIKPEYCPALGCNGDLNATHVECTSACPLTCAEPYPRPCIRICYPPGCECNPGYVYNEITGKCISLEDCPAETRCDYNSTYSNCPSACQPTCDCPEGNVPCTDQCMPPGCICEHGYLLNKTEDCVRPEDCPGGAPKCGVNETYTSCKVPCPSKLCPEDDSGVIHGCDPVWPCPGGCECENGYLRIGWNGPCVLPQDCPPVPCSGSNEVWNSSPSNCLRIKERCEDRHLDCEHSYYEQGRCVCMEGYFRNQDNICVPESECPDYGCGGDINAMYSPCPSPCRPTCSNMNSERHCIDVCDPPGCVCKPEYVLNEETGQCIKPEHCPGMGCNGDLNATYSECTSACPLTCDHPYPRPCLPVCYPPGCECNPGYVRDEITGKCIRPEDCPVDTRCNCNSTYSNCPSACQPTCDCPEGNVPCTDQCMPPGCICKDGYLLNKTGDCVNPEDCPGGSPKCGVNETYVSCKYPCPSKFCREDDSGIMYPCDPIWPCPGGCECESGYLRIRETNQCVLASDCPAIQCSGDNEVWNSSPPSCLRERCDDRHLPCDYSYPSEGRCVCKDGYYRNQDGVCVPESECLKQKCGYNEVYVPCRQICPPQNCEIAYTEYACGEETKICEPGCNCLPHHLRNGSGICIPSEECPYPSTPVCGINEIARDCKRICPPQTCLSKYALIRCPDDIPCEPGCDCIPNYLRDDRGMCIPSEKCPEPCPITDDCIRTCTKPNPENCPYTPSKENIHGCNCKEGYILLKRGGPCIRIEDCPPELGCGGDPHAVTKRCPHPCPANCDNPNAVQCKRMCEPIACECKPGYLLNCTGHCILPDKCPGGNPCGKNAHFAPCRTECNRDYCPVDDRWDISVCHPPSPCLPGCVCNLNHKRKSRRNPKCIKSSKCRKVKCTRKNEIWDSCPSPCLNEKCKDRHHKPTPCNYLVLNCEPRCVCKKDHYRNANGTCVPASECHC